MSELPIEKKFAVLCDITRAQHFAWHEAVKQMCPDVDVAEVTNRMWQITGEQTAVAYLKRVDMDEPLAPQIAASIVWSSDCMGEEAKVKPTEGKDEAFVEHTGCPWHGWHERTGLLHEDQPGCDAWFQSTVETVNARLGTSLRVETQSSLPAGGACCLRRFWNDGE